MTSTPWMGAAVVAGAEGPDLRRVFLEHGGFVLRAVARCGVPEGDVEDVAQEVFLVAHRRLHTFTGDSSMRTWLFGIAMRVASNHRRRAHVRREQATDAPPVTTVDAEQFEAVRQRELRARLNTAVASLDADKRTVFVLYELEGVPMSEIARAIGCPRFTAYSRLREARRRVRAFFEATEATGGRP